MFSVDELVVRAFAEIFDVFDDEGVGGGLADKEDYLGAAVG